MNIFQEAEMERIKKVTVSGASIGFLLLFLAAVAAFAQVDYSTATLKGTVVDPQGAVVSGATVTVTNNATGIKRTTRSGSDGSYQLAALPPGTYQITFEAQ